MDKGDFAILISVISLFIAGLSASYTRRQAVAAEAQLKRKLPVMEFSRSLVATTHRGGNTPWDTGETVPVERLFQTGVIIRNLETSCGLRLVRLQMRWRTSWRGSFALSDNVSTRDPYGNRELPEVIPAASLHRSAVLDRDLQPCGAPHDRSRPRGDVANLVLLSRTPLRPADFDLKWEWADGAKRQ